MESCLTMVQSHKKMKFKTKHMNRVFKFLAVLFLCGVLSVSCDHDHSQNNYREFIDAGKVSFNLTGRFMGYDVNTSQSFPIMNDFRDSYRSSDKQNVYVNRYSADLQSGIKMHITVDSVNNKIINAYSYMSYNIIYLTADKTILDIQGWSSGDTMIFSNFSYNPASGNMSGDFSFHDQNQTDTLEMSGNFNVTIYKFEN